MKKSLKSLLITTLILFSSCVSQMKTKYLYSLDNSENTTRKNQVQDTFVFDVWDSESPINSNLNFEDDFIKINWLPSNDVFIFKLENKTNSTIKVIWDNGVFTDFNGASYRILNSSKNLYETDKITVPTPIIKKGFIKDLVYPINFNFYNIPLVYYKNAYIPNSNLLPVYRKENTEKEQEKIKNTLLNKDFKILLPIEINGKIKEYIFRFKIDDIYFESF